MEMDKTVETEKTEEKISPVSKQCPSTSANVGTMQLNNTKAGMEGLDVETINNIINNASKGSKFFEHKLKQQKEVEKKIAEMKHKLAGFSSSAIQEAEREMDKFGEQLEGNRDYSRFIVHIDMDAFYASVEMRDDPSLKDKPMAVGSDRMLSTSNYIARRFGVRAAMPGFIAKKLCPQLVIVPCNFDKYTAVCKQVRKILKVYDPDFTSIGLDEAYLDITPYVETSELAPEEVVEEIRAKIFEETKLTASAGIASNGFLAKIVGDLAKPNGQTFLPKTREAEANFVNSIPIRKVNGIGGITELLLKSLDINTCKDIWKKRAILRLLFKPLTANRLVQIAKGYDEPWDASGGSEHSSRKSISSETTLDKGTTDVNFMISVLEELAEGLSKQLEDRKLRCKNVVLKIKTVNFDVKSRSCTLANFTAKSSIIFGVAKQLLEGYVKEAKGKLCLRLLGIRLAKWEKQTKGESDASSEEPPSKQLKLEEAFAKCSTAKSENPNSKNEVSILPSNSLTLEEAFAAKAIRAATNKRDNFNSRHEGNEESSSKQLKLEEAFAKACTKTIKSFPCPACQEHFTTEVAVSIHLDSNCTELYISPRSSQSDRPSHRKDDSKSEAVEDSRLFTCPICYKQVISLVENIEIASSDHVNHCITTTEDGTSDNSTAFDSNRRTWKINATTTT